MQCFSLYDEKIYEFKHKSGLKIQILPKKGFRRKYAYITVDFGSCDSAFMYNGKRIDVPHGTAHFLEHKMFEKEGTNIFEKFSKTGAECNAFTNKTMTSYYFNCVDKFEENLEILFEEVFVPFFTPESVEKEKGIIIQEINMYRDDFQAVCQQNFLGLLYKNNPIKIDIAGTEETVNSITPEILYKCHKAFYRPEFASLTIVGDVDVVNIEKVLDRVNLPMYHDDIIERIQPEEPEQPASLRSVCKMDTSYNLFAFGFKDNPSKYNKDERLRRKIVGDYVVELLFSQTSDLVDELYRSGDIYSLYAFYEIAENYGFFGIFGATDNPDKVEKAIRDYIANILKEGIDNNLLQIIRRASRSWNVRMFDSLSNLATSIVFCNNDGYNLFDYCEAHDKITEDEVNDFIKDLLCKEMVVTIVEPKGR